MLYFIQSTKKKRKKTSISTYFSFWKGNSSLINWCAHQFKQQFLVFSFFFCFNKERVLNFVLDIFFLSFCLPLSFLPLSLFFVDSWASLSRRFTYYYFSLGSIFLDIRSFDRSFISKKSREKRVQKSLRIKLLALPEPNDDHLDTYIKVISNLPRPPHHPYPELQVFYICFIYTAYRMSLYLYSICFSSIRSYGLFSFIPT